MRAKVAAVPAWRQSTTPETIVSASSRDARLTWRQIQLERAVTGAALALGAGWLLFVAVPWLISPPNVALGKPVRMSSERPEARAEDAVGLLSPAGAVDGKLPATYDVCSKYEPNPWLVVDLKDQYDLTKVIVYNRGECCWGERELPMVVEASVDDRTYVELGRRSTPFTQQSPWSLALGHARARYVRVRVPSTTPRELVLSEVAVYGRPADHR